MTESAAYDFNTGAMKTSTDFNGRTTTTAYDAVLRPTSVTSPTGTTTAITYSDGSLQSTQTVQLPDADHTIVSETFTQLNGRGQPAVARHLVEVLN